MIHLPPSSFRHFAFRLDAFRRGQAMTIGCGLIGVAAMLCFGCEQREAESIATPPTANGGPVPVAPQPPVAPAAPDAPPVADPLAAMQRAGSAGDWQAAWNLSDQVLGRHAGEAMPLMSVAEVAFRTGRRAKAAELIAEVAAIERFKNVGTINRGVAANMAVGRVFETIDLLRSAVDARPTDDTLRRLQFNLLHETEQADAARSVAETLVRRRAFDRELLLAIRVDAKRTVENDTLARLLELNPQDRRLLIGQAKTSLDRGQLQACIKTCDEILRRHPQFGPARRIRWTAIRATGDPERIGSEAIAIAEAAGRVDGTSGAVDDRVGRTINGSIAEDGAAWLLVGDHYRQIGRPQLARRCYAAAARSSPQQPQAWAALVSTADDQAAEPDRGGDLVRLRELQNQFVMTPPEAGLDRRLSLLTGVVGQLRELGQPWLAEAWAAYGIAMAAGDATPAAGDTRSPSAAGGSSSLSKLREIRRSIVSRLRKETPWQQPESLPNFDVTPMGISELSDLVAPSTSRLADAPEPRGQVTIELLDEANERGLVFNGHAAADLDRPGNMHYATLGCGGGVLDFDRDGWPDLYLMAAGGTPRARNSEPNELFRNCDGRFRAAAVASGTGDIGFGQGMTAGDLNNDGFDDIVCLNYGRDTVLINRGDGTFEDATDAWLATDASRWSTSGAIADLDADGLPDLVTVHYCDGVEPYTMVCRGVRRGAGQEPGEAASSGDGKVARACSPLAFAGVNDQVHWGTRGGNDPMSSNESLLALSPPGRGLGLIVAPLDTSAGLDLFVANDMTTNQLWSSAGVSSAGESSAGESSAGVSPKGRTSAASSSRQFLESGLLRGLAVSGLSQPQGSMGIAVADFDRDRQLDLYVTNFESEYNTMHLSNSGSWIDRTAAMGLADPTLPMVGFGSEAVDLNHNGLRELVVTNGHVDDYRAAAGEPGSMAQPFQVFASVDGRTYRPVDPRIGEYLDSDHIGRALFPLDADNDGRMDLVVTHQSEPAALLMNRTEVLRPHVSIELVGTAGDRNAIGATVTAAGGEPSDESFVKTAGDGYLCRNQPTISMPLRPGDTVDVAWPSGNVSSHRLPELPFPLWTIVEPSPR